MEKKQVIAGIAYLLNKNTIVKADDEEIQEVPMEPSAEEVEIDDSEVEVPVPDVEMPMVLEDPFMPAEDIPSEEEMDQEIEQIQMDMEDSESPSVDESHQLGEAASGFLDRADIPKEGAQVKRIGSYDVLVLGSGVALNRAQIRYLLEEGLIHIAADTDAGGQALVFPTGSRF